jgi:hypothetical protein
MGNTIISASQKLMRGLSTKFSGDPYIAEAAVLVPSQFRDNSGNPNWFFGPNGIDYKFEYSDLLSASDGYRRCPPLAAVINRKAQAYINGRTMIMNSKGKEATDATAKKIRTLLAKPNPLQSWKQFEAQQKMYIDLFGFCIVMPLYSYGFESTGPVNASSMWNLPSYMVAAKEVVNKMWYNAQGLSDIVPEILLKYKGLNVSIPTENLFIFKDFVPNFDSQIFPDSRVRALSMPINNIIAAYESRNELINYAGSQGILTPETDANGPIPMKEGEKAMIQADFKRQYGIKKGQFRYIISPAAMKWQAMGKATKDLMLFEEISDDIMRICDGYGYPSPLLNSEKGPSVSNTEQYKKQIYEDTIIPESLDIYEQWNSFFRLEPTVLTMVKTYDHLPILQQDQVLQGQARLYTNQALLIEWQNNLITLNQWREEQGIDTIPGDDIYYYQAVQLGKATGARPATPTNNDQSQNQDNETDDAQ